MEQAAPQASAVYTRPPLGEGETVIRRCPREFEVEVRAWIADRLIEGRKVDLGEIMCEASLGQPANRLLREFAVRQGHKERDFDRALRRERIERELGASPRDADHFIELLAAGRGLAVQCNGVILRDQKPYHIDMEVGGEVRRSIITADRADDPIFASHVRHNFRHAPTLSDFRLEARTTAGNLSLPWSREAVNDAVDLWHAKARHARLERVTNAVLEDRTRREREAADAALLRLVAAHFDGEAQDHGYAAAALKKFIWQVKRKLEGLPVTNHAMVVLLGRQGNGKSTFIRKLLGPVSELAAATDFGEATDNRNISLWKNAVLFFDEMGFAGRADMDAIKNAITAETLTRRPMRSNTEEQIVQRSTFIGASNKSELSDLLRDSTGLRRFLDLRFADAPDWEAGRGFDWLAVWQGVDHRGPDPMAPFAAVAAARQEAQRERTNTEEWLATLDGDSRVILPAPENDKALPRFARLGSGEWIAASDLYAAFRQWEDDHFPGARSSIRRWAIDVMKAEPRRFEKKQSAKGAQYRWAASAVVPMREPANDVSGKAAA